MDTIGPESSQKRSNRSLASNSVLSHAPDLVAGDHDVGNHSVVMGLCASKFSVSLFTRARNNLQNRSNPSLSVCGSSSANTFHDLGDCNFVCEYCGALFWSAERLTSFPSNRRPRYNQCFKGGRVSCRLPTEPPSHMKVLLENQHFVDGIRAYNSMFAMTSFGAKVDRSVNCGSGPYVFKVEGQFTDCEDGRLSEDIVKAIMDILDEHNELVKLFRCARDLCYSTNVPDFSVCLYNSATQVSYDSPAPNSMGAIIHEGTSAAEDFDIVVHYRYGRPQRISKLNNLYMPLQYPLLHIYGDRGWSPTMRLVSNGDRRNNNLTMNIGGRLFQQYLVDAYISLEQECLDYICANQNLFQTEYLQGVHDAIAKGDTEVLHNFHLQREWPEIVRYMAQYPALKANDRPDIISRVFQLKVEAFRSFIKHDRLFGTVVAHLYTIEFQKQAVDRITSPANVDRYISTVVPDPNTEANLYKIITESMMHGPMA
ncbi:uncharacterized protein LOC143572407 [Bidens hawaiensis]|uniref:uncharacterized protein LOC143572407 n=1 Tax=Bidens hawaiensis TaxID=980011 RepID=UPI00404B246B